MVQANSKEKYIFQHPRKSFIDRLISSFNVVNPHLTSYTIPRLVPVAESHATQRNAQVPSAPLPPKDEGHVAYRTLTAAIILESVALGFPLAYGMFQDHYLRLFPDNTIAPWIGVLSGGIPFLGAPLITLGCEKYNINLRQYLWVGWSLCWVSLLVSVFCTSLSTLIVTQGLLYGIGCLLIEIPMLTVINSWFDKRRGLAYGLIFGGADLYAFAYTFLVSYLLNVYGLEVTMVISSAMLFNLGGGAILFLKRRPDKPAAITAQQNRNAAAQYSIVPQYQPGPKVVTPTTMYFRQPLFYIFSLANLAHALAYYIPFIYLPSFTTEHGHSHSKAALVLAIGNLSQIFGEVGFGKLSDKLPVNILLIISTIVASLSTFIFWGLFASKSLGAIIVYAILFASFGSGFLALWARMGTMFGDKDAQMVYSNMAFGRGIGSIMSGPVSYALLGVGRNVDDDRFGAGKYASVVIFVGVCMACSAFMGAGGLLAVSWKERCWSFSFSWRSSPKVLKDQISLQRNQSLPCLSERVHSIL